MRTGLLLLLVGAWVVTRSVVKDDHHKTLIDRLLDFNPAGGSGSDSGLSANPASGANVGAGIKAGEQVGQGINQAITTGGTRNVGEDPAGLEPDFSNIGLGIANTLTGGQTRVFHPGQVPISPQLRRLFAAGATSISRPTRPG